MLRILIAEDNDLVRNSLKLLLEHENDITVVADASDGQDALDKIGQTEIDIVITDLNMPRLDGFALIEALKAARPEIRMVVYSALNNTTHAARSFRTGASAYITKDSNFDELLFALRQVNSGKKYLSADLSMSVFEKNHQLD